ncbi:50S ribosomal protein L2, plastid-like [Olea europaea var. sylvestris]|uniref:50S ribosomal protein L2, plastid-like n=1 Tax=Olea europaea var. sylvestris TaxID=158386 RepID=UPI000C1D5CB0|nr:50S ribosomal protein L2, plastid-like [Olea europaea var. sylvestris]
MTKAKLIAKEGKLATLKLPSREVRLISKNCSATVGQVGNVGANQKSLGRVGSKRWLGGFARDLGCFPLDDEAYPPLSHWPTLTPVILRSYLVFRVCQVSDRVYVEE